MKATCSGERPQTKQHLPLQIDAMKRDTELEALELKIEICTRRHRCKSCGNEFTVRDYDFECPQCHGFLSECLSGDELELKYVEVEENEPTPVGTQGSQ